MNTINNNYNIILRVVQSNPICVIIYQIINTGKLASHELWATLNVSLMAQWLGWQCLRGMKMYSHDLAVMGLNPGQVELEVRMRSTSI